MAKESKITGAFDAEAVVRRSLERQHADVIKTLTFYKSWYASSGSKEYWDVEGFLELKKGKTKKRSFRYQVDPESGEIFGYEETPIR
ncbi:unnamed protein product [marine sediment metagenome]|uniref:PepSY domain-containing protein n=1 Tax=marine sediment metagenome TaxID=412755 RepID=X1GEN2_9ZZZZ